MRSGKGEEKFEKKKKVNFCSTGYSLPCLKRMA